MFKNEFQGCNFVELFNPSIKDPLASFRVLGSNGIQRLFDKNLKETIFQLEGSPASTKLALPKEIKSGLSLIQRYIVFQVNIKETNDFSLDIGITDLSQNKRNLHFSTTIKDLMIQPLSAKIPIKSINRLQWINLIFDLTTLINDIWKNQTLKSIESFTVCANCKVRKIFTINKLPVNQPDLITEEPIGLCVDFPRSVESITQIFSLNDVKPDLSNLTFKTRPETSTEPKSKNVFKIAFGSKLPLSTPNELKKKTLKPIQQPNNHVEETTLDTIEKTNQISPISTQTNPSLPLRRKSETENQQQQLQQSEKKQQNGENIHVSKITTWNQRAVKSSLPSSNIESISTDQSANTARLTSFLTDMSVQSTKIPHPPPQSTRPSNSSARKLRLTTAVKSNKPNNSKQSYTSNVSTTKLNLPIPTGDVSSNEEDIHNNSSKTLIDYSPFKNKIKQTSTANTTVNSSTTSGIGASESLSDLVQALKLKNSGNKKSRQMQLMSSNNDDSTLATSTSKQSSVYSFSSRPKPAGLNQRKDMFNESLNSSSNGKVYDFRKYSNNNIKPIQKNDLQTNLLQSNDNFAISSKRKLTQPFKNTTNNQINNSNDILKPLNVNNNTVNIIKKTSNEFFDSIESRKSLNINQTNNVNINNSNTNNNNLNQNLTVNETFDEVLDSFEAQMLRDMKAEMDEPKLEKKDDKKEEINKIDNNNNNNRKVILNPKSPDAEYFEIIQQDSACGFHSPFSDDNNHTASEKYNFDAITSSIDETTTSLSKKTPSRNARGVDSNNYQDEMDVSLQLNLPSKSINLKDLQLNYSPLQNHPHHTNYMIQKNPITEEPSHYDDSQADIDEIVSDSDEEVDLLYDPSLNCYYDPKTSTYYELNLS